MTHGTKSIEGQTVLLKSIRQTSIITQDTDVQGFIESDGTNRGIGVALTVDGGVLPYVWTNGDDVVIYDDADRLLEIMRDLTDNYVEGDDITEGRDRLTRGLAEVATIYPQGANWCAELTQMAKVVAA